MTVATSFIALAALLTAAPPSHRVQYEYRQDARQVVRQDAREARDDVRDLREASNLLSRFQAARSRRDMRELRAIDGQVRELIAAELGESRRELRDERRDVREERRDAREERRDMRTGVHEAVPVSYDGHGQVRRDEARDVAREQRELAELRRIAKELDPLYGRFDRFSLNRKDAALRDLVALANHEVRQDRRELHEDRQQR